MRLHKLPGYLPLWYFPRTLNFLIVLLFCRLISTEICKKDPSGTVCHFFVFERFECRRVDVLIARCHLPWTHDTFRFTPTQLNTPDHLMLSSSLGRHESNLIPCRCINFRSDNFIASCELWTIIVNGDINTRRRTLQVTWWHYCMCTNLNCRVAIFAYYRFHSGMICLFTTN